MNEKFNKISIDRHMIITTLEVIPSRFSFKYHTMTSVLHLFNFLTKLLDFVIFCRYNDDSDGEGGYSPDFQRMLAIL